MPELGLIGRMDSFWRNGVQSRLGRYPLQDVYPLSDAPDEALGALKRRRFRYDSS